MALYAFDGTWQQNQSGTNIVLFRDAYRDGPIFYEAGVGTRVSWLGKFAGGLTGIGGRRRVREALKQLNPADAHIDIVGFSRGAALALHFANSLPVSVKIRFLGLFDTVPSFGIPGNSIDLGWQFDLPEAALRCYHAMALDETRLNFPLHHLRPDPRLTEMWFRGVHSDIGGGNTNTALSSIPLDWMFESAQQCGMQLDSPAVEQNRLLMNAAAPVSMHRVDSHFRRRQVSPGDRVHESVLKPVDNISEPRP